MTTLMIGRSGEMTLPGDLQERCGFKPEVSMRLIETRSGLLLVPISDAAVMHRLVETTPKNG